MTKTRSSVAKLFSILGLVLAFASCGQKSQDGPPAAPAYSFQTDNLASQGQWIYGDWSLQGAPVSFGDLGADIQHLRITPQDITYETFGHLAAESFLFNTNGYDFGGDCLFRVRSTLFGIAPDDSGSESLRMANPQYELIADPRNRNDCAQQIGRINSVILSDALVFRDFEKVDDHSFKITPKGLSFANDSKVYKRSNRR